MSKTLLHALMAGLMSLAPTLQAQAPARPLTESELLKTLDGLGKGDPITKQPLSAGDQDALPESDTRKTSPKKDKEKEEKNEKDPTSRSKKGETEITAKEGAFVQRTHTAVFSIDVFVKNPDFTLACDKLTAWMKHDGTKPGSMKTSAAANPNNRLMPAVEAGSAKVTGADGRPVAPPPGANDKTGGLERAVAEGNVVITQDKLDENGNLTQNIGRAKKAVYESATGNIVLTGKPEVSQGINSIVATDENTVITLNRSGEMKTVGPHKTVIKEGSSEKSNGR